MHCYRELVLAKKEADINEIAVNPGLLLNTNMANEAFGKHLSSANKRATILYELTVSEDYKNASGKYFDSDYPKGTLYAERYPLGRDRFITYILHQYIKTQ